ncbi:MAG: flagellar type III secretion system pore protein FliP [Candidatus Eisenbacteria bacterium]|uniref:Flagellar biosynthetic protein FliP n=1 Tax=Eiseniibacteriota bacterium TaxID=2212470 RepID=A0A937XC08_UNCEI|nr:flagellar type III secretion system pore protein FliP [Candidatus Eisenbacteria bacterium]
MNPGIRLTLCALAAIAVAAGCGALSPASAGASFTLSFDDAPGGAAQPQKVSTALQILLLLTVLTVAPALVLMVTSFTRIVVVLSFVRQALSTQQMPPNQVLVGLALLMTFFVMTPTWNAVHDQAVRPYLEGEVSVTEALKTGAVPLREFMLKQTREKDLELFVGMSGRPRPESPAELSLAAIVPAFMISELRTAFQMGFVIYLPFLIVDMVIASVLMSMGMLMLPPAMISLPFKILLFVLVDGWHLVVSSLVASFR